MDVSLPWEVHTVSHLTLDHLYAAHSGQIGAVRVRPFIPPHVAETLTDYFLSHPRRENYTVRWRHGQRPVVPGPQGRVPTDIDKVGPTDADSAGSAAVDELGELRAVVAPAVCPIDALRDALGCLLPGGAEIGCDAHGRIRAGIGRIMERSDELVHADTGRRSALTAIMILRLPETGGQTAIWRHQGPFLDGKHTYLFEPGEIPPDAPTVALDHQVGDLVLWNPLFPHVVRPFTGGVRVVLQTWVLLQDLQDPKRVAAKLHN
jgi:hypothetical protein